MLVSIKKITRDLFQLSDPPPENQPMTRVVFGQHACFMVSKCSNILLKWGPKVILMIWRISWSYGARTFQQLYRLNLRLFTRIELTRTILMLGGCSFDWLLLTPPFICDINDSLICWQKSIEMPPWSWDEESRIVASRQNILPIWL